MSKKHFVAVASTINHEIALAESNDERMAIENTARALCSTFASFNGQFDRDRFLATCGVREI